jgi:hypothetical protein
MPDRRELILQRLTEEGAKTAAFFRALKPEHWQQQVYTTGPEWGVYDILCHFISAEKTYAIYFQDVKNGGTGVPRGFVIDDFNRKEVRALRDANQPAEALTAQFERQRAHTRDLVRSMDDADFDRTGYHPWFGDSALEDMLKLIYRHNMMHQRDIHKAVETGQPVPHVEAVPPTQRRPRA